MRLDNDTIAAVSTPQGRGGIGILRVSGPHALDIFKKVIQSKIPITVLQNCLSRKLIHGFLIDDKGEKVDEVLVAIMPENRSYTGEFTIEINCHGGKALLDHALENVINAGARPAKPGEFTRRAMLNGKIDLIKAEAINDLIHARTIKGIKAAWKQIDGGLTRECKQMKDTLITVLSDMEATIDFEVDDAGKSLKWKKSISSVIENIDGIIDNSKGKKYLQNGCSVVLTGPPNSGKSSLFNTVLNVERSIVCELPGTTRDHISELIELDGVEVKLTDTAGIRETADIIETRAIERSLQQVEAADVIVHVLDQSQVLTEEEKVKTLDNLKNGGILILNKKDLTMHPSVSEFIMENGNVKNIMIISATNREGLDDFLNTLTEIVVSKSPYLENPFVTNIRQKHNLELAKINLQEVIPLIEEESHLDIVSDEIKRALNQLEDLLGVITSEEILDSIFNKFCIGK